MAGLRSVATAALISATDVNPDPNIFECFLNANEKDVTIAGANVHATVYNDDMSAAVRQRAMASRSR